MHPNDEFPMIMEREAKLPEHYPPISVGFGMYPMIDDKKSKASGYEVYVDTEFVRIVIPGDRNSLYFQPAQDSHRQRFPKAYEAFKARTSNATVGLPLEQWAAIGRSMVLTLRMLHIRTVEELAAVHDGHIDKLGQQGRELRAKAQAFLKQATDSAALMAAAEREQDLQAQIAAMQAQINALAAGNVAKPAAPQPGASVPSVESDDMRADVEAAAAARRPRRKSA